MNSESLREESSDSLNRNLTTQALLKQPALLRIQQSVRIVFVCLLALIIVRTRDARPVSTGSSVGSIASSGMYYVDSSSGEIDVDSYTLPPRDSLEAAEAITAEISAVDDLDDDEDDFMGALPMQGLNKAGAIPKRLSDAFQGELSDEFLVYLNLKAELDEQGGQLRRCSTTADTQVL